MHPFGSYHSVAALAATERMTLLTKDDDFDLWHRVAGLQIVWLRLGNASNHALVAWLDPRWNDLVSALEAGEAIIKLV